MTERHAGELLIRRLQTAFPNESYPPVHLRSANRPAESTETADAEVTPIPKLNINAAFVGLDRIGPQRAARGCIERLAENVEPSLVHRALDDSSAK
jgi:hypothetical protein